MPDLAEQDGRRPLGAPARRARVFPPPIADVLVITGPSGVGKGTLIRLLLARFPRMALSVSATTREPRPGEEDGVDYRFLSPEEFEERIDNEEFLEWAEYAGNRYGTLRSELDRDAHPLVLEIEVQGARQVRSRVRDAVSVFIAPPSEEALRTRLVGRGSDSPEQIERRLETAWNELAARDEFDHVVVNDDLDAAVEELSRLVATIFGP
ncbi:MAG TPA: guanylate kinase [Thermoleophilaceae bacterium]|nr:guanylate kinase [Thermoleophilaceae bacterium]